MTIGISVNGTRVVVPGVYTTFNVDDSLANVTPGPRNVVIIGEAAKGIPGALADIRGIYFNDYNSLKDYYGSGAVVDAARMLFSQQASPAFAGAVGRVYVYKTNNSGLAGSTVAQGSATYGRINAAEYGVDGNLIRKQVKDGTTEVKPTFSAYWVPVNASSDFKVRVSGGAELSVSAAAQVTPASVVSAVAGLSGTAASGGAYKEIISAAQVTALDKIALAVSGHRITLTCSLDLGGPSTFQGADIASVTAGQILYIPAASALKGALDENVGAYAIVSASASQIVADKISSVVAGVESAPVAPVVVADVVLAGGQSAMATAEAMVFGEMSVAVDSATDIGTGASLEVYMASGARGIAQRLWSPSLQTNAVSAAVAVAASVNVAVAASVGSFGISGGSWASVPAIGSTLWVLPSSVLAGPSKENVGVWIVTAAGSTLITARKVIDGGLTVSTVALASQEDPFKVQAPLASTSQAAKAHVSSAERQVWLDCVRQSDGLSFPADKVGGRVILEIAYTGSAAATLSISSNGILTTSCTNPAHNISVNLAQYSTMSDLVALLNTKANYYARVPSVAFNALNPKSVLDQVQSIGICGGVAGIPAYNGRIKADYYDFKNFLDANFKLVAFQASATLQFKAGLPDADALPSFLSGGALGATNDASILAGFDAALKVSAVQVAPLFSRDAAQDIEDGLTDTSSTYTVDSVLSAAKSHALTASNDINRKERFSLASCHCSFEDAKIKAQSLSSERVQMAFQMVRATGSDGNVKWFQPWMLACAFAAGRAQANLGIPLLRKSFAVTDVKHLGAESVYSDSLVVDFDPDTKDVDDAIVAGLLVVKNVAGFGVRMESPDLTTRSRDNDPKGWVYERASVLFTCDQVKDSCRTVLENYIGSRTSDVSASVIKSALDNTLRSFVSAGALLSYAIDSVTSTGNGYNAKISIYATEAIEFVTLDVLAKRSV
jgi:hypothetical protein